MQYAITIPVPDASAAGTVTGIAPQLVGPVRVVKATMFVNVANATGTSASIKAELFKYSGSTETEIASDLTVHATDDAQELTFTLKTDTTVNLADGDDLRVKVTTAGGTTAAASGMYAYVWFDNPLAP